MQSEVWKTEPEWFKSWFNSEAYHVLYGHRSEHEAAMLVRRLGQLPEFESPAALLDAGCGAGRHARAWAELGWEVSAFDLSRASIERAQNRSEHPSPTFRILDLRQLSSVEEWGGKFDVVTNFFTSLGYFQKRQDQMDVLSGFHHALKADGWLLIDYLNLDHVESHLISEESTTRGNVEFFTHRRIHEGWIEKSIQFEWEGAWQHHVERVQALSYSDFKSMLSNHGFTIQQSWGNYALKPRTVDSPRCIILAQKIS